MTWPVSLPSTNFSPRLLTNVAFSGHSHLDGCWKPALGPEPIQRSTSRTLPPWLHLNAFRGEPAISTFGWHFTPIHRSSPSFATLVSSILACLSQPIHSAHAYITMFRIPYLPRVPPP